jgi:undecaprenyl-diphosphatase
MRKPHMAVLVVAAGGGGLALNHALKTLFARQRPSVVPPLDTVHSLSFPSGHAMLSAAVYLSLAVLVARLLAARRARAYVLAVAATLTVLIGLTRVYLGVHYPTDVLAGWVAGCVWALSCGLGARALQQRGRVEPPSIDAAS